MEDGESSHLEDVNRTRHVDDSLLNLCVGQLDLPEFASLLWSGANHCASAQVTDS